METRYGLTFMKPASDGEQVDEEAQREAQDKADFYAAFDDAMKARIAWISERIGDVLSMKKTSRMLAKKAVESRDVAEFEQKAHVEIETGPCPLATALGYESLSLPTAYRVWNILNGGGAGYVWRGAAQDMVALLEAMEADGYELTEAEKRTAEACRTAMEGEEDD